MSSADNLLANTFDSDQAWQNIGPDLDKNVWHSGDIPERCFWQNYKHDKLLIRQRVNEVIEKQHMSFCFI